MPYAFPGTFGLGPPSGPPRSKDESNCRSPSTPAPAFTKDISVGCGTVSCGMIPASAAAAVELALRSGRLWLGLPTCRAKCCDKALKSCAALDGSGYMPRDKSAPSWPVPFMTFNDAARLDPACLGSAPWSEGSRFRLFDGFIGCIEGSVVSALVSGPVGPPRSS